ncbi:zinc finger protein [Trichonephila clavipes]|nr:zinc finger protein [Trichonephila clavipes]
MELAQQDSLQNEIEVPVVKKPRIPPFFISPKGDWRQLVALAKLKAPSFQSQMSGRFLKVTVSDEVEYRDLSRWLETTGVEFKSFMLKQDRPVKVVVRGLPSNTEPEDIKAEIEAEGFKVAKISQMKNFRTKAPMPLFYVQIENGVDAPKYMILPKCLEPASRLNPSIAGIKPDKDSALPSNYRPISLLSCLSKVYEFVLLQRLNQHCAAFNFIIPQQCGFRPKCSTVHQLLRVTELIHSGFAKHEATGILFLDIAKAFDKIWHDGLLIKLIRLDFPPPLIKSIPRMIRFWSANAKKRFFSVCVP